jgi:hypothetical protein
MKNVIIPGTVRNIGNAAFAYCLNLESITCESEIPVDLSSSEFVFSGINKNTCNLIVPAGSGTVYQAANQWSEFVNISEKVTTQSNTGNSKKLEVFPNPASDFIRITGVTDLARVEIYNFSGQLILNTNVSADKNTITLREFSDGVYVIKVFTGDDVFTGKFNKK